MGRSAYFVQGGTCRSKHLLFVSSTAILSISDVGNSSILGDSLSIVCKCCSYYDYQRPWLHNHPSRNQSPEIEQLLYLLPPPSRSFHRRRRAPSNRRSNPLLPPRKILRQYPT